MSIIVTPLEISIRASSHLESCPERTRFLRSDVYARKSVAVSSK